MTNQQIQKQVCDAADQILSGLGKQCGSDPHIGIAALAVAMCSLASADGLPLSEVQRVICIAYQEVTAA